MIALMLPRTEAEILERRIALHESRGELAMVRTLRERLASLPPEPEDSDDDDPAIDDTDLEGVESLELLALLPTRLSSALSRYGATTVGDLSAWNAERLLLIPGFVSGDVQAVKAILGGVGAYSVLGSGDVPKELPELDGGATDRRFGRTHEDVREFLAAMAAGESERSVAGRMGAKGSWYGNPHQQSQSLKKRHYNEYVELVLEAFERQHKRQDWWVSASIDRTSPERWKLVIVARVALPVALQLLPRAVQKPDGSCTWRSVDLELVTGAVTEKRTLATMAMRKSRERGKRR